MGLVEGANETLYHEGGGNHPSPENPREAIPPNLALIRLSNFGRAELVLELEPLVAAKAKERQIAAQNNNAGKAVRENSHEQVDAGRTDETLSKIAGVSSNTMLNFTPVKNGDLPKIGDS